MKTIVRITTYLGICTGLGLLWVVLDRWSGKPFTALLWAFACLAIGAIIGFLFGIPRVIQDDSSRAVPSATGTSTRAQPIGSSAYRLLVNTNLEQVSDWLTKIFVGLGLTQLQKIPDHLNRFSTFIAYGLGAEAKFLAAALIVYFTVIGFLGGYLITRLFLARLFREADKESTLPINAEQKNAIATTPLGLEQGERRLTGVAKEAARRLVGSPMGRLSDPKDLSVWAKAQLDQGNPVKAVQGYKKAVERSPENAQLRYEFAVALFFAGEREAARDQLLEAYRRIVTQHYSGLKESVCNALIYQSLYREPPEGFQEAIKYGEEYVRDSQNLPSGAIWVNLAAAYGQKMTWLKTNDPSNEGESNKTRTLALNAVKKALEIDAAWGERLRMLLEKNYPNKDPEENDLEVFEQDGDFRMALELDPVGAH